MPEKKYAEMRLDREVTKKELSKFISRLKLSETEENKLTDLIITHANQWVDFTIKKSVESYKALFLGLLQVFNKK